MNVTFQEADKPLLRASSQSDGNAFAEVCDNSLKESPSQSRAKAHLANYHLYGHHLAESKESLMSCDGQVCYCTGDCCYSKQFNSDSVSDYIIRLSFACMKTFIFLTLTALVILLRKLLANF